MSKPLLSMTGFGRAVSNIAALSIEAEIRSVNHRFFDPHIKVPRVYSQYEGEIKRILGEQLSRGRVELFVTRRSSDTHALSVVFNRGLFDKVAAVYEEMLDRTPSVKGEITRDILSRREVLEIAEDSSGIGAEASQLYATVKEALMGLQQMRAAEGENLRSDLLQRLAIVEGIHQSIKTATAQTPLQYREKLTVRLQRIAPEVGVDPARLAAEVALMCDRIDTTEEVVRLESHFTQFRQVLSAGQGAGRKLDFLTQEMGRELNTITSKAQDATVQHLVIDAKAEIERIKEQVQNVE